MLGGTTVFLSGANLPWLDYGNDFGNVQTNGVACELQEYVRNISANGGNSVRVWLLVEGDSIPEFNTATGEVVATDASNTLIDDVDKFVAFAASQNVLVTLCLWNGDSDGYNPMGNEPSQSSYSSDVVTRSSSCRAPLPVVPPIPSWPGISFLRCRRSRSRSRNEGSFSRRPTSPSATSLSRGINSCSSPLRRL